MNKTIGFIGTGNIATAIIGGILKSVYINKKNIFVFDIDKSKMESYKNQGINTAENVKELILSSKYVFLTVKPQNYTAVLNSISEYLTESNVIVTVAPGFTTDKVKEILKKDVKVIRTMPNTPLLLGAGATAIAKSDASKEDFDFITGVFKSSGIAEIIPEKLMDEVISINGSSPAYVFLFARAMLKYAETVGIDYAAALNLITSTLKGSAEMIEKSGKTPSELAVMVKSPGGTTEAALNSFAASGFEESIIKAMDACTKRAKELGK